MKINGRFGVYQCEIAQVGWTYAKVNILIKQPILFGILSKWIPATEIEFGSVKRLDHAQKMYPKDLIQWYKEAVDAYEKHKYEWNKFYDGECRKEPNCIGLSKLK